MKSIALFLFRLLSGIMAATIIAATVPTYLPQSDGTRPVEFVAPWKMTVASSNPVVARDFAMKFLGYAFLHIV